MAEFKFYSSLDLGTKDKMKLGYELRKMVLNQAQDYRMKNGRNILELL